jgi:hypothetical protein
MADKGVEHYVLRVESYVGEHSARAQHVQSDTQAEAVYAIVRVDREGAEIIDDGYRSWDEAKQAWPQAH